MTFRSAHEPDGSHRFTMATGYILGRITAGEGAVEEIPTSGVGSIFVLKAGDDMTGSLGVGGATRSTVATGYGSAEIGSAGNGLMGSKTTGYLSVASNAFYNTSSAWKYVYNGYSVLTENGNDGNWRVYTAPSGTAGNTITFTERLKVANDGKTTIYSAVDEVAQFHGSTNCYAGFYRSSSRKGYVQFASTACYINEEENLPLYLCTNSNISLIVQAGGGFSSRVPGYDGSQRYYAHFYHYNTTANVATQYVHVKTNINVTDNIMASIQFLGYEYGAPKTIDASVGFYAYAAGPSVIAVAGSGTHTVSAYKSTDGYVVVTILLASTYYVGFTLSAHFYNPTGSKAVAALAATYSGSATGVY
jgi:hypothetical protein